MLLKSYLDGLSALLFPELCVCCTARLHQPGQVLCTLCRSSLPETRFDASERNVVRDIFTGRIPVEGAMALLFFEKGSKYRKLLYSLKYKQHLQVGYFLGRLLGTRLKASGQCYDAIIPVPLHRKRLRTRGYNQSALIAHGISEILALPVFEDVLERKIYNPTQTRKGRYDRWENVADIFRCSSPNNIAGKHLLLVDDVITTGATLEAAGMQLLRAAGVKLSIATAAYAL